MTADRPTTEPRTYGECIHGTSPDRDCSRCGEGPIRFTETEAAQGAAPLDLLRDLVQHWDAGDIDHDYDAMSGAFDAARDLVRATIGLSGEHRHPEGAAPRAEGLCPHGEPWTERCDHPCHEAGAAPRAEGLDPDTRELLHQAFDLIYTRINVDAMRELGFDSATWCESVMPLVEGVHDHSKVGLRPGLLVLDR